jgi:hypothetical protein
VTVVFMLNLLFDFASPDGLFTDRETPGVPLLNSKHWLKVGNPNPPANFDPENPPNPPGWEDLGPTGTLFVPNANPQHVIAVRIAPDPNTAIDPAATAEIVVAFGRPVIARQRFASPFVNGGQTQTSFRFVLPLRPAAGITGWFARLAPIGRPGRHVNLSDRYEFALGVNITSAGVTRSYGEDPEFDVGG